VASGLCVALCVFGLFVTFFARDSGAFLGAASSSDNPSSDASEGIELIADSSSSDSDKTATFLFFSGFAFASGGGLLVPRFTGSVAFFGFGAAFGFAVDLTGFVGFTGLEAGSSFSCFSCVCMSVKHFPKSNYNTNMLICNYVLALCLPGRILL
jgi:hypothetical protein